VKRRLLLAGCGHAHLFVLEALAAGRIRGVRATLVSPSEEYFYSGMIPGVLAGMYAPEAARFLPARLARAAGAEWVRGAVSRVDAAAGRVELEDGRTLPYDGLSLNVGSRLAADDLPGVAEHAHPVKPMGRALALRGAAVEVLERASADRPARIVVVGGGTAGVEVALCLEAWLARRHGRERHHVTIVEGGGGVLEEHPEGFRARAGALLRERGIAVHTGARVASAEGGAVRLEGGGRLPCDLLVWATGPRAPGLFRDSGLPTDARGYLRVDATLAVPGVEGVFGGGDCVAIDGFPWVPRAGVYAVREGEALARNLERIHSGRPPRPYRPQRDWLSLMNTGSGAALLAYRGASAHGAAAWRFKDWIDRRFMRRFRRLER
jgi:pyridine nucleotide-disulfide oxidoreductase family protein